MHSEIIGVADGVGGWNRKGVDPGLFAKELCNHVKNEYERLRAEGKKPFEISLRQLLIDCVAKTKAIGTSTFVMARIDHEFPFV